MERKRKIEAKHTYDQWTAEQQLRLFAALDLYLHYLVKNFELCDLPDATTPSDDIKTIPTIVRRVQSGNMGPPAAPDGSAPTDGATTP